MINIRVLSSSILISFISVFSIVYSGCSSTYTLNNFSSYEKFYEDFNKSAYEKPVKIFLINDSSFVASGGAEVVNDTLLSAAQNKKERIILLKNKIKNIQFYYDKSNGTYSAKIVLNSGAVIKEDNVELLPDSSVSYEVYKYDSLPLNKIKKVSYKNNLLGACLGFLIGSTTGFLAGGLVMASISGKESGLTPTYYFLSIQTIGSIAGIIWGGMQGYTYVYQFNP